jgi:protein involved in polysaccharide export with SLBB domain
MKSDTPPQGYASACPSSNEAPPVVRGFLFIVSFLLFASSFATAQSSNVFDAPRPPAVNAPSAAPVAAPAQNAPAPSGSIEAISAPTGYVLSANDQVAVEVFGEDDLRTNGRLNSEGNLSVPLLGSVHLGGLTLGQATARLTELYGRDYLVNPKLSVSLVGYAKRRFTVLGQVNRPGSYEMPEGNPGGIDLLEAIAMAGGYTRIAAPDRISVRRHRDSGADQILKVNAKKLANGEGGSFLVLPGDTLTIGESIF